MKLKLKQFVEKQSVWALLYEIETRNIIIFETITIESVCAYIFPTNSLRPSDAYELW